MTPERPNGQDGVWDQTVDITALFREAAASLSFKDPMLCNKSNFNLQDSMAALEIMDKKMDCCEIPVSEVAPMGRVLADEEKERMVFPRPAPTGIDDRIDRLPWEDLTISDSAYVALECLGRLEALLGGASVVESTYTCLYAHEPVVADMKERLGISSADSTHQASNKSAADQTSRETTLPQQLVYASILLLLELTDAIRNIILNADIFEEEDFTISTYGVGVFEDRDDNSCSNATNVALQGLSESSEKNSDEGRAIKLILEYQLDLSAACTVLAKLAGNSVAKQLAQAQKMAKTAASKLEDLRDIAQRLSDNKSERTKALLKRTFDLFVTRPLVGNAPVRVVEFLSTGEMIGSLTKATKELDWAFCQTLLEGDSIGRIRRMLSRVSTSAVNVLTRSLLVLNLYFDDQLFGQYPLAEMVMCHMQQLSHVPDEIFQCGTSEVFLNRLAKPIYDILKLSMLNRNRQRAYIEAVMLVDWASLCQEAALVDLNLKKDPRFGEESLPHFSLYSLYLTIDCMDHYLALGVELDLFSSAHELAVVFWYRDFLLSALINQLSTMRKAKAEIKQSQQNTLVGNANKRGKKKGGKGNKKQQSNGPGKVSPQDAEDEFEFLLINAKRVMCRGLVRFFASAAQAGFSHDKDYEFVSKERLFQKRFEAFEMIQQPPPLQYADYVAGSDFTGVPQADLIASTSECFQAAKVYIDRLITQSRIIAKNFLAAEEAELQRLAKVCLGNSIYIQKLRQVADSNFREGRLSFDKDAHNQYRIIKVHS